MENSPVVAEVRAWLSSIVIGLGLCPFAEAVFKAGTIQFTVCESRDPAELLKALSKEMQYLVKTPRSECETTLLIAPNMLSDFLDFNDFTGIAQRLLEDQDLKGTLQLVGFHPGFRFAESEIDATENYTNRAPYPLVHLLREVSITEVSNDREALLQIPERNTRTLRDLGIDKIKERLRSLRT